MRHLFHLACALISLGLLPVAAPSCTKPASMIADPTDTIVPPVVVRP